MAERAAEIERLRSLVQQACDAIEFDQRHTPDRVMAWHLRFLELGQAALKVGVADAQEL